MLTRETLVAHILMMRAFEPDYAREAMLRYHAMMPWLELLDGVREKLK